MLEITSVQNPLIKKIVQLQDSKYRKLEKKFILEGIKFISTAINAGLKLDQIFVTQDHLDSLSKISQDKIILVSDNVMSKLSSVVTPSGILAIFYQPEHKNLLPGHGLVLDHISDPGNMGTLIRTAAACNIKNIIVINGVDVWSPKVVQASAGTISLVNIYTWTTQDLISNKQSHKLYGLAPRATESIFDLSITSPILFAVGNESNGLSSEIMAACNKLISLPMPGEAESLNAAVAGSIAMYYLVKK